MTSHSDRYNPEYDEDCGFSIDADWFTFRNGTIYKDHFGWRPHHRVQYSASRYNRRSSEFSHYQSSAAIKYVAYLPYTQTFFELL